MRLGVEVTEDEAGMEVHDPGGDSGECGRAGQGSRNPDATVRYNHGALRGRPNVADTRQHTSGEGVHQLDLWHRAVAWWTRSVRDRVSRLVVHLVAADQRHPRRAHGPGQQITNAVLRFDGNRRLRGGLLRHLLSGEKRW